MFTYITELHGIKYRPRVLMVLGMLQSLGTLILPMVAWLILPRDWDFVLFGKINGKNISSIIESKFGFFL